MGFSRGFVHNSLTEVMKTLTSIATISLPLGLVASAYGMNVAFPGKEGWTGLAGALVLMGIVGASMLMFFRRRKWLGAETRDTGRGGRPTRTTVGMPATDTAESYKEYPRTTWDAR